MTTVWAGWLRANAPPSIGALTPSYDALMKGVFAYDAPRSTAPQAISAYDVMMNDELRGKTAFDG